MNAPTRLHELRKNVAPLRAGLAGDEQAGELAHVDQHPADTATETYEREQERERELGRILDLEARIRRIEAGDAGSELVGLDIEPSGDMTTPLDEPAPPPMDLADIPMGKPADMSDPDQQADIEAPGYLYGPGRTNPAVGEDEDPPPEGSCRPE